MLGHTCNSSTQDGFQASPGSLVRPCLKEPTNQQIDEHDKKSQARWFRPKTPATWQTKAGWQVQSLSGVQGKFKAAWVS